MSSNPDGAAEEGGAENTIEDLEATDHTGDEVKGGKNGSVIVFDFVGAPIKRYK